MLFHGTCITKLVVVFLVDIDPLGPKIFTLSWDLEPRLQDQRYNRCVNIVSPMFVYVAHQYISIYQWFTMGNTRKLSFHSFALKENIQENLEDTRKVVILVVWSCQNLSHILQRWFPCRRSSSWRLGVGCGPARLVGWWGSHQDGAGGPVPVLVLVPVPVPVLRQLLTRNEADWPVTSSKQVNIGGGENESHQDQSVKMSFLRRGNSCVTPDMEIRKRLEVRIVQPSFWKLFICGCGNVSNLGAEIFWQSRQGREREPDQGGVVQRSQLLRGPNNWVSFNMFAKYRRSNIQWCSFI